MKTLAIAFLLFASAAANSLAQSAPVKADNTWHYAFTPYLWLPTINGNVNYQRPTILPSPPAGVPPTVNVGLQVGPNQYLSNLNFAFLAAFEARRNKFSIFGDYMNLNLSSTTDRFTTVSGPGGKIEIPIASSVNTHVFSGVFTIGAGYTLTSSDSANLDVGVGMRNVNFRANSDYSITGPVTEIPLAGSLNGSVTLTDVIFDVRGRMNLGGRWYVPYYGDLGTGNSNSTWQYMIGIAYGGRTNDIILATRGLGYNQNNNQLVQNVRFTGPLLGYRIHW